MILIHYSKYCKLLNSLQNDLILDNGEIVGVVGDVGEVEDVRHIRNVGHIRNVRYIGDVRYIGNM